MWTPPPPVATTLPFTVGIREAAAVTDPLERLDRRLSALVRTGEVTPGAVALITVARETAFRRAYGWSQDHDENGTLARPRKMSTETIFDVASLTKVFTAAALMSLVETGEIGLEMPVKRFLPAVRQPPAHPITVDELLTHRAGLLAWQPVYLFADDREEALTWVSRHGVGHPPGRTRRYSDLGFLLLGGIIEAVTGKMLDAHLDRALFAVLELASTSFNPPASWRRSIAATSTGNRAERRMIATGEPEAVSGSPDDFEGWRTHTLVGEVQDGNAAYAFGGIAGSAGAFSTATDLATFCHSLIDAWKGASEIWRPAIVRRFIDEPYDRGQGRGWWTRRIPARPEMTSFGHRGFTGCEVAVVPEADAVAVLLTNRLHTERDPPPDHDVLWREVLRALVGLVGPTGQRLPG